MKEEASYDPFKSSIKDAGATYFPFGKPGGGAPLRNNDGRPLPQRRGVDFVRELDSSADKNKRRQAADEYLYELSECPSPSAISSSLKLSLTTSH